VAAARRAFRPAAPADDARWMAEAVREAVAAGARGEVPVGAVVAVADRLLARAGNESIAEHDPTGHAEIVALRGAAAAVGNYRLTGATLYATVEPCAMCMGAAQPYTTRPMRACSAAPMHIAHGSTVA